MERIWKQKKTTSAEPNLSEASQSEDDVEPGIIVLYKTAMRKVVLESGRTVLKIGRGVTPGEAEGLKVAAAAGIPAPRLHNMFKHDEEVGIRMDLVQGQSLDLLWPTMSTYEKKNIAEQLRGIIRQMRELKPPPNLIGSCDRTAVRDTRVRFMYEGPICHDEDSFNNYLISSLFSQTPSMLRESFRDNLQTNHRVVFTHGDLTPRNILMHSGRIAGVVDWEESGWYPEYWESVKFFERPAEDDWKEYAEYIFPGRYSTELIIYTAMSRWRNA
ncbi:hypothetical protein LLEC1_07484 [Akanthomyces lecanii]|uniref:Aminoglycoside phosphotransferase domain-containing protein n=1 Tax=Cordyceps confragosa TaxID=2714763 RepID=A0A179IGC7_CORDF|nr:hypothetical protein LLEC1_07484 [Akanthomyces lecanii]